MRRVFISRRPYSRRQAATAAPRRRALLYVERVEDRIAPAVLMVETLADSDTGGLLSLRGAILDSINHTNTDSPVTGTGNDTIEFAASLFVSGPQTITLTTVGNSSVGNSALGITGTTTIAIVGPTGANGLTITTSGSPLRAFYVASGNKLTLENLTISGGVGNTDGGGIYNNNGTLTLTDSTVSGNTATSNGGGIYSNGGTVNIGYSTISGNATTSSDGGGIFDNAATVNITNSTIAGNTAHNDGGGIGMDHGTVTLVNDTVSDNTALSNGGGVRANNPTAVNVLNTIIAGNLSNGSDKDVDGTFVDDGNNLIGNTTGSTNFTQGTDKLNVSADLGTLANNGGPTETMALMSNSPAINAGADTTQSPYNLVDDQRGPGYPRKVGPAVDIGAYEFGQADLEITNNASPTPTVLAGDDLTYTIVIDNVGTAAAVTNTLSDPLPAGTTLVSVAVPAAWTETDSVGVGNNGTLTFTNPSLAAGASSTFTVEVLVAASVPSGTVLSNTATDSTQSTQPSPNPYSSSATATTTVDTAADLSVTNNGTPDPVLAGDTLSYTVVVANNGPSDAQSVTLDDPLPAGTTLVSVIVPLGWTETDSVGVGNNGTLTFADPTLAAGASSTFTIVVQVASNVPNGTILNDTATAATATAQTSPDPYSDFATATTTVDTAADLSVTNNGTPDPVLAGDTLSYTVVVANNGPSDAQSVTLDDPLPAGTTLVSVIVPLGWTETDSVGVGNNGTLTFADPTLAAGESSTFTIVVQVASNVSNGTILNDTATAATATAQTSPDPYSDSATATTTVDTQADLGVTNNGSPDPVIAGEDLTYTVVVTNYGPSDAQAVTLSDPLPAGTTLVSVAVPAGWTETDNVAVGANGTLSFSVPTLASTDWATFTIEVHVASSVLNGTVLDDTATAHTTTAEPVPDTTHPDSATAETSVIAEADLAVSVTAAPNPVLVGADLTYTIMVTNDGPSDAQAVELTGLNVPARTVFVSFADALGWSSTALPAVGATSGSINASIPTLPAGATGTFTFKVQVAGSTASGTQLSLTPAVSAATTDIVPRNNRATATATTTTIGAGLATNLSDPSQVNLLASGNTIVFTPHSGLIGVEVNGVNAGLFAPNGQLIAYGQGTNDSITVNPSITLPAILFGSGGGDTLHAGGGNTVLVGGAGNATLYAGTGDNILIAGPAANTSISKALIGTGGNNILIAGTTIYDMNIQALDSLLAEWGRTDLPASSSYATRMAQLTNGGGLNGSYVLNASTLAANNTRDSLTGGTTGQNWYIANVGRVGVADIVVNKKNNEVVTQI